MSCTRAAFRSAYGYAVERTYYPRLCILCYETRQAITADMPGQQIRVSKPASLLGLPMSPSRRTHSTEWNITEGVGCKYPITKKFIKLSGRMPFHVHLDRQKQFKQEISYEPHEDVECVN